MESVDDSQKGIPSEERFCLLNDQRVKLISLHFMKRLPTIDFDFDNEGPQDTMWIKISLQISRLLNSIVYLPHHQFWSSIIFQPQSMEKIFLYFRYTNISAGIEPLIIHSHQEFLTLYNNHDLIYKFLYRLFSTKESEENFLSQIYHDEILMKIFADFQKICLIFKNFPTLDEEILLKITSFLKRQNHWSLNRFENYRNNIVQKIAFFNDSFNNSLERFYNIFYDYVNDLWIICRIICLVRDDRTLFVVFLNEHFINIVISFYCTAMGYLKAHFNRNPFTKGEMFERVIQRFQICTVTVFLHYFNSCLMFDLESALEKSNVELYKSLESFDYQMRFLFTNYQFVVDFFQFNNFNDLFKIFYGDQLKRIIKPETSLSNYENALKEARDNCIMSNLWYSSCDFFQPEIIPSSGITVDNADNSSDHEMIEEQVELEHIKSTPEIMEKEKLIREVCDKSFGDGFIYLCLEAFNFDHNKVINAIFEESLPGKLKELKQDLTKKEANDIKEKEVQSMQNISQVYIGKKDKVKGILKNKDDLKDRILGLSDKIAQEEEAKIEDAKRMIERGADKEQMKKDIEFACMDIYNDEFDDTYEDEELIATDAFEKDKDSDKDNSNKNYSLPNRDQWKYEKNSDEENDQQNSQQNRQKFYSGQKSSNASQYHKNQYKNKKTFNQKNNYSTDGGQQQQNPQPQKQQQQQQQRGNDNFNKNSGQQQRFSNNNRGNGNNFKSNSNQKRPNFEGSNNNPNKRK